jgi:hypothetical protein
LSAAQFRLFDKSVSEWRQKNRGKDPSLEVVSNIVATLEKDMEIISERALNALVEAGVFKPDGKLRAKARNFLVNDRKLQRLIKTSFV